MTKIWRIAFFCYFAFALAAIIISVIYPPIQRSGYAGFFGMAALDVAALPWSVVLLLASELLHKLISGVYGQLSPDQANYVFIVLLVACILLNGYLLSRRAWPPD